ncbi:FecR domain-containing protein [Dyadobacter sp. LHD-138]|uniref:FecR family protein n=1 Tax=Dyadobacter sp. LHD-138 TaxID=3071413 RepID=UPI0027DFB605|nr:FecR domain-containing protein [Dyadobacter sp. LHD-138]MDQ6480130.1 FecR domain-containing protein [Dyadobacter sp. LHD-138]
MAKKGDPFAKADLISRYLKGDLSYEEIEQLRLWTDADKKNQQLLDDMENPEVQTDDLHFFSTVNKEAAWENLTNAINESPKQRSVSIVKYWKYVAAVLAVGFSYLVFYLAYKDKSLQMAKVETPVLTKDVLPGENKATLTLADGSVLVLKDMANGTVNEKNGIRISKKDGQIVYEILNQQGNGEISYNTIRTPAGGQYHVVLPDGSKVWLNSESSLHFPTAFSGSERTVNLTGEGYFEITKNTHMPFVVQAPKTRVEVLGTHFNVMAYANEGASKTTLLEGSVKVGNGISNKIIVPGQQVMMGDRIQVRNVDTDEAVAWKNGYFQFQSENLSSILRQLKRWYDVEVEDEQLIPDKHFTAVISRNNSLSQVLRILEMSGELKFEIEGKKISIQEIQ